MFVYLIGLAAGAFGAIAQGIASPLGFFREPKPDEPTLWRQALRGLGWLGVAFAALLWLYLVLSALTADNIAGRGGILARVLDSVDGIVVAVLGFFAQFIPDVEVTL